MKCLDATGLYEMTGEVHDYVFDVEEIEKQRGKVEIWVDLYGDDDRGCDDLPSKRLIIRNVKEFYYTDTEKTGYYQVNNLVYNPEHLELVLNADNIDGVYFDVSSLNVELVRLK